MPSRVRMSRQAPWRADNPDAIIVDRSTKWGNPYRVGDTAYLIVEGRPVEQPIEDKAHAVLAFRTSLTSRLDGRKPIRLGMDTYPTDLSALAGHDLACWCPASDPCHADVLLELANRGNR